VAWSGNLGLFVAVGDLGSIFTSPNGVSWTNRSISTGILRSVAWTGYQFIAVGNYGTVPNVYGLVVTSNNGINWNVETGSVGSYRSPLYTPVAVAGNNAARVTLQSDSNNSAIWSTIDATS
jgi:hypothetical protein